MMYKVVFARSNFPLPYFVAYLVLAVVALVELFLQPIAGGPQWMVMALLLLLFGLSLALKPWIKPFNWQTHLYLALQAGLITGLLALRPGSLMLPMLFCILCVTAPLLLPLRSAVLWILTAALINTVHCTLATDWDKNMLVSLPYTVGYFFCGTFAYSLARTRAAQRHSETLLAELQATYQQLQDYTTRIEELAVSQERNRLAREMHDALGHRLTVAAVQLEGAERLIPSDPARASRMVHTVHEEVVEALAELRRTVATLRTPLDDDLSLPTALTRLTNGFEEATGIIVNLRWPEGLPVLPDTHRLTLYRVAQEALTNVKRHAQARQVWLELSLDQQMVTLLVKDDGRGFSSEVTPTGFGLRGLRERAAHLNGAFHLESNPGAGTQICFHLPLPEEEKALLPLAKPKSFGWKLHCPMALLKAPSETPARPAGISS